MYFEYINNTAIVDMHIKVQCTIESRVYAPSGATIAGTHYFI